MTTRSSHLVVDASVAVNWYLADEPDTGPALALLQDFRAGQVTLAAPTQILFEVPSAITLATRRATPRLTIDDGAQAVADFATLGIQLYSAPELLREAYTRCYEFGIAFYDATYFELSRQLDVPFITADRKLHNRIRHLLGVLWIDEWS